MPFLTLMTVEMLKMQLMTWMVNITGGLSFSITLEVTVVIVIVVLKNLVVTVVVILVELIPVIAGVQASILSLYYSISNRYSYILS